MTDPTPIVRDRCASCKKPIRSGDLVREVNTPTGRARVHDRCLVTEPVVVR